VGIIKEIKELSRLLPECSFSHVRREVNHVALDLAQRAMRRNQCKVMRFNVPHDLQVVLAKDTMEIVSADTSCNSGLS
jgi:hypothetical protein